MQKGTVKWFNPTKAMGSSSRPSGIKTFSFTSRRSSGPTSAASMRGQLVEYELVTNRGKTSAENLKVA
jgi:CspA family cold shock protein